MKGCMNGEDEFRREKKMYREMESMCVKGREIEE
jgi:ribosome-associated protein YbcJ (S4-like RNA binding protein)